MTEPESARHGDHAARKVTLTAAVLVLALAVGAVLWPRRGGDAGRLRLLVFDTSGRQDRAECLYENLARYLAVAGSPTPGLSVVRTSLAFREALASSPAYVLCSDGVALQLDPARYVPLATGRRAAPRNQRPRGVLVYRKVAGFRRAPWSSRPARTVLGDSLSLVATGSWRAAEAMPAPAAGCAWGPDPFDHAPALHAARLGAFDYAVVRHWDAERFFASGLLDPLAWGLESLGGPVPDLVVMASADLGAGARRAAAEKLTGLGRMPSEESSAAQDLRLCLDAVRLVGFNRLLDQDFDEIRRIHPGHWPGGAE